MRIDRKKFIGNMLSGGAAVAAGAALGDEFAAADGTLPPGSCGDPDNVWFGKHIFPLEPTMADGPSCFLKDGRVIEPAKEIPVFRKTDVVVVGGGPAGFAAAIGAARAGAKVALVERYGSLGGLFTNGMVLIMLSTSRREESGRWTLVTRGVCEEFMERSCKYGKAFCNPPASTLPGQMWQPTVDPEWVLKHGGWSSVLFERATMFGVKPAASAHPFAPRTSDDLPADGSLTIGTSTPSTCERNVFASLAAKRNTGEAFTAMTISASAAVNETLSPVANFFSAAVAPSMDINAADTATTFIVFISSPFFKSFRISPESPSAWRKRPWPAVRDRLRWDAAGPFRHSGNTAHWSRKAASARIRN